MIHVLFIAVLASAGAVQTPECWIRDDRADLELRISRLDSSLTAIGKDTLKLCYSRPRKLGRPIMGRLVPFGEAWRLGANEATTLHAPIAILLGDLEVPPGWYSLYALPRPTEWRIVVNEQARRWGIPIDDNVRSADVGTVVARVERLAETVEHFTMRFESKSPGTADLVIEWDLTRVRVPVRRDES